MKCRLSSDISTLQKLGLKKRGRQSSGLMTDRLLEVVRPHARCTAVRGAGKTSVELLAATSVAYSP